MENTLGAFWINPTVQQKVSSDPASFESMKRLLLRLAQAVAFAASLSQISGVTVSHVRDLRGVVDRETADIGRVDQS